MWFAFAFIAFSLDVFMYAAGARKICELVLLKHNERAINWRSVSLTKKIYLEHVRH
jgi:hypothetical protein